MKTFAILLLTLSTLTAQEYLYTPDVKVAEAFIKALDEACGYPNPSTKTWTAVSITTLTNKSGTNYVVEIPSVYAPIAKVYLSAKTVLPKDRQLDVAITNETKIATDLAAIGTKAPPPAEKGTLTEQKWVLVSADMVKVVEPVEKEPIAEDPKEPTKPAEK